MDMGMGLGIKNTSSFLKRASGGFPSLRTSKVRTRSNDFTNVFNENVDVFGEITTDISSIGGRIHGELLSGGVSSNVGLTGTGAMSSLLNTGTSLVGGASVGSAMRSLVGAGAVSVIGNELTSSSAS